MSDFRICIRFNRAMSLVYRAASASHPQQMRCALCLNLYLHSYRGEQHHFTDLEKSESKPPQLITTDVLPEISFSLFIAHSFGKCCREYFRTVPSINSASITLSPEVTLSVLMTRADSCTMLPFTRYPNFLMFPTSTMSTSSYTGLYFSFISSIRTLTSACSRSILSWRTSRFA